VNPDQIAAQVEGSVAYGLSATFYGECTVKDGRIAERNFDTYEILRLAEMGNVVLVGRGAAFILGHLPQAFHVRLVASVESRVTHMAELRGTSKKTALAYVEAEDKARQRFIRRYFQVDVADPLLYNLVINVDRTPIDEAARIVGDAVLARI